MTLVEVMIATLLVGFGLGTSLAAFTALSRTSTAAARRSEAVHSARQAMESLRSQSYNALPYGTWQYEDGIAYTVSAANSFTNTKNIELIVNWNSPGNSTPGQIVIWSSVASCIHP